MTKDIDTLMIFAAGFGKRMKEVTKNIPKPLIPIHNKPILYYILDSAIKHGFRRIFINTHYLAKQIEDSIIYFQNNRVDCPKITLLHEEELLDTGGTIKNGLKYFDRDAIITHNADVILHSARDFFSDLKRAWNPQEMDFLLLTHETEKAIGYVGKGDFEIDNMGLLTKPKTLDHYKYMYTGVAIIKPELITSNPQQIFSLQEYYNDPKRIYGYVHSGTWCHVSCPEDVESTMRHLARN